MVEKQDTKREPVAEQNSQKCSIIFACVSEERFNSEIDNGKPSFAKLKELLSKLSFDIVITPDLPSRGQLANAKVVVLGLGWMEIDFSEENAGLFVDFMAEGGGMLIVGNDKVLSRDSLSRRENLLVYLASAVGLSFRNFFNYQPKYLQVFSPHYITANLDRVRIGQLICLEAEDESYSLAWTRETKQPVIGYFMDEVRVVVIGDETWLSDDFFSQEDNEKLARNLFRWISRQNPIDIEKLILPERLKLGQNGNVTLTLLNDREFRPKVKCVLESDADAIIAEPISKMRSIPPGSSTVMQWSIQPQRLGPQLLRLRVEVEGEQPLFFDSLSEVICEAPGFFTLQVRDETGAPDTEFSTGQYLQVEGMFHWTGEVSPPTLNLELEIGDGLICEGRENGQGSVRWYLQAVKEGSHELKLLIPETKQIFHGRIHVHNSIRDEIEEINVSFILPLDAEIAARLAKVRRELAATYIQKQSFTVASPEDFIKFLYAGANATWLQGVLAAARRERWYNPELLKLVLDYFAPTYIAGAGSFVPYDPNLASKLSHLHPSAKRNLEYNFLRTKESSKLHVKQAVAAYLLHEKYGHGFFYTQTRLGQQLAILQTYNLGEFGDTELIQIGELIEESAIIVNEGFATWLELTFLDMLEPEVRQSIYLRQVFLLHEGGGLRELRQKEDGYFYHFPSIYDSPYREGYEYLNYISENFNIGCALCAFRIATDVELGITETIERKIPFTIDPAEVKKRLLTQDNFRWRSQHRLERIAEFLYENNEEVRTRIRNINCLQSCRDKGCQIEVLMGKVLEGD